MALRQTTAFVENLLRLIGLAWAAPAFSKLCGGQKALKVNGPYRGSQGPLHQPIHSTGITVAGQGEWTARKHGGTKRRVRRKLHVVIYAQTVEIRSAAFAIGAASDVPMLPELLDLPPPDRDHAPRPTANHPSERRTI